MRVIHVAISFLASLGAALLPSYSTAEVPVHFTLDRPGFVTLVVETTDLMVRTDREAKPPKRQRHGPENQQAAPGDVRLLVTRVDDPLRGPVRAVRFEQEGEPGDAAHYTSPVGEVRMADVRDVSARVRLAQHGGNYELAVPLEVLGLKIDSGTTTLGDIGVVVGEGNEARARFYWSNKASSMTSDIPTEARLLPVEWGVWRFER